MNTINDEAKKELLTQGIKMIILFGSRAGCRVKPDSDYDMAVLTTPAKNLPAMKYYTEVLSLLADIFNIPEDQIDLSDLDTADPLFLYEIISSGVLLYGDPDTYAELKSFAFREYIASQDLRILERIIILKRQKLLWRKLYAQKRSNI